MTDLFAGEDERVPFSVLAARAPAHDPSTCRRDPAAVTPSGQDGCAGRCVNSPGTGRQRRCRRGQA